MAVSKLSSGFPMTMDTNWSNFLTLNSGFTGRSINLRHVEKDIYYLYVQVEGNFPAGQTTNIGTFNLAYFGNHPVTGYLPAMGTKGIFQITTAGMLNFQSQDDQTGTSVLSGGFIIRREV